VGLRQEAMKNSNSVSAKDRFTGSADQTIEVYITMYSGKNSSLFKGGKSKNIIY
jgi:hypothetical protein